MKRMEAIWLAFIFAFFIYRPLEGHWWPLISAVGCYLYWSGIACLWFWFNERTTIFDELGD